VTSIRHRSRAGFTLVELLVGMSLALIVMTGVLSTFSFLGRNLARLAHQQKLETEARRTLAYFAQDVRMATGFPIGSPPSNTAATFTLLTSAGTTTTAYNYYASATTVSGVSIPAGSLTRTTPSGGTPVILLTNLLSFDFDYYDANDTAVTDFTNKVRSIKKVAMDFHSQTGRSADGTQAPVFPAASPRLTIRNKALLN
jgi:prepilin-type N-terminal cleavage/methylation domain-containing protein